MKRKTVALLIASLLFCNAFSGCGARDASAVKDTVTLTAAHVLSETHPYHLAWLRVAELVAQRTGGGLKIEVFANSTLGNERDIIEGMQLGIVDLSCMSSGALASFSSSFLALDLPFLFADREAAYKVLDSEIGQELLDILQDNMLVGFSFWENGFRNISNNKREILVPEDVRGLKIRTLENELQMGTFVELGANAIPMAWGEVYTALQQGTIDGQENPLTVIYQSKIHEVTKNISLTGHFYASAPVIMSKKNFEKLSPEYQQILTEAIQEVTAYERELCIEGDEAYLEAIRDEGGTVIEEIDKELWRETVQPIYDQFEEKIGVDLIRRIQQKVDS